MKDENYKMSKSKRIMLELMNYEKDKSHPDNISKRLIIATDILCSLLRSPHPNGTCKTDIVKEAYRYTDLLIEYEK